MNDIFQSTVKVRFADCDPLGHLNNVKYLEYMLNAREDHVEANHGFTYEQYTAKTGCTWVAIENQISYLKELRYNSSVNITSRIIETTDRISKVEMTMHEVESGQVNAVFWMTVIHFDLKTRRSAPMGEDIQSEFQRHTHPLTEKSFEQRVAVIRQANKKAKA